ncbi:MAG: hypothetical protein ACLR5B_03805 [Blautia sp.]
MKKMKRKSIAILAAAAISMSLAGGQIYSVYAGYQSSSIKKSSLIPDNVTIDEPTELSNVSLPSSEYGTLYWVDDSFVPTKRTQSCKVEFEPYDSVDLSYMSGWDAEDGVLKGKVTVVVSSISGEDYTGDEENDYEDYEGYQENTECGQDNGEQEDPGYTEGEAASNDPQVSQTPAATDTPGEPGTVPSVTPEGEAGQETLPTQIPSAEQQPTAPAVLPEQDPSVVPEVTIAPDASQPTEPGVQEGTVAPAAPDTIPSVTPGNVDPAAPDSQPSQDQDADNIFDQINEPIQDDRPSEAEDTLTPEEQAERAVQNHSCAGISVSGIELPWYVQFRATSGESYQFTNEDEAAIFRSYEFELWNLKTDSKYEIPDGQYISVTVPVKAGYEYTIEHLLDNGAMETIVPSVDGNTMIFSTHSFSPFGIAGSKPLIGENIAEDGYSGGTISVTSTPKPASTAVPTKAAASTTGSGVNTGSTTGSNTSNTTVNNSTSTDNSSATGNNSLAASGQSVSQNSSGSVNGTGAVRTGDNTPVGTFVILVVVAAVVVILIVVLKKKKNN